MGTQQLSRQILAQATSNNPKAKLTLVDPQGEVRKALVHRTNEGYTLYLGTTPQRERWNNWPQVRDPHTPPLMFMGPTGVGASPRELFQQPGTQPTVARPSSSRAVPPPLSFMGHATDTNSWAGSHHNQQPPGPSWPRLVNHSLRNYPVINHTNHVIPDKAALPNFFPRGPPPPYTPRPPSYNYRDPLLQGQPCPSTTMATTSRPSSSNQQAAAAWQGGTSQREPYPQERLPISTTAGLGHLPQVTGAAVVSTDQPGMMQQAAAAATAIPGVTQRANLVASPQVAAGEWKRVCCSVSCHHPDISFLSLFIYFSCQVFNFSFFCRSWT